MYRRNKQAKKYVPPKEMTPLTDQAGVDALELFLLDRQQQSLSGTSSTTLSNDEVHVNDDTTATKIPKRMESSNHHHHCNKKNMNEFLDQIKETEDEQLMKQVMDKFEKLKCGYDERPASLSSSLNSQIEQEIFEKKMLLKKKLQDRVFRVSVGGQVFHIPSSILSFGIDLENFEGSDRDLLTTLCEQELNSMDQGEEDNHFIIEKENGCIKIQRDPTYFPFILAYLRLRRDWKYIQAQVLGSDENTLERSNITTGTDDSKNFPFYCFHENPFYVRGRKSRRELEASYGACQIDHDLMKKYFVNEHILKATMFSCSSIKLLNSIREEAEFYCIPSLASYLETKIKSLFNPFDLNYQRGGTEQDSQHISSSQVIATPSSAFPLPPKMTERVDTEYLATLLPPRDNVDAGSRHQILLQQLSQTSIQFSMNQSSILVPMRSLLKFKHSKFLVLALSNAMKHMKEGNSASPPVVSLIANVEILYMLKFIKYGRLDLEELNWAQEHDSLVNETCKEYNLPEFFQYIHHCYITDDYLRELIGETNWKMREEEESLREAFVVLRENPKFLEESKKILINVFDQLESFSPSPTIDAPESSLLFNFENPFNCFNGRHNALSRPEIVTCREEFIYNFNLFTKNLLNGLDYSNVCLAGGSVLCTMLRAPTNQKICEHKVMPHRAFSYRDLEFEKLDTKIKSSPMYKDDKLDDPNENMAFYYERFNSKYSYRTSDVDMFLYGLNEEQALEKIKHIIEVIKKNTKDDQVFLIRSGQSITIRTSNSIRAFQIILRLYSSIEEVLCGFDVDSCCFAFDGVNVLTTPRGRRSIIYRYNMVDTSRQSYTYEKRLYKYACRGFRIYVPNYNRNYVKREGLLHPLQEKYYLKAQRIPNPSAENCRGLAYLLLQERRHYSSIYSNFAFASALHFHNKMDRKLKDTEKDKDLFKHDCDYSTGRSFINTARLDVHGMALRYQKMEQLFVNGTLHREQFPNPSSFNAVYGVNDVTKILQRVEPMPLQFVTINPGRQDKIGSFHPHNRNFYEDAYCCYHTILEKKMNDKEGQEKGDFILAPHYWVKDKYDHVWYWESEYDQDSVEEDYQKFLSEGGTSTKSDCGIDFMKWRKYGKADVKRDIIFKYAV
ncbi:hypothetical protein C9374_014314 [Naegleria lovaniensis]|uniref:Potassium channel tetramerisation-type BTB domain-containing protein n=1 Tax=Naegleria lovaniensis TaxID=51637 RepID=A0AA88G5G0_NAELO|nr:uncharacterized protein C9374_014314 [Naegleria lovaniensis]KAG2370703.1 hypothetical protein C9374_014314 [Naegleria lovaniensis]